jgi:hypothetical protein
VFSNPARRSTRRRSIYLRRWQVMRAGDAAVDQ